MTFAGKSPTLGWDSKQSINLHSADNQPSVIEATTTPEQHSRGTLPPWISWLLLSLLTLGAAFLLDGRVDSVVQTRSPGAARSFARWLTQIGDWWPVGLCGLACATVCFFCRRFESARSIIVATITGLATGLVAT